MCPIVSGLLRFTGLLVLSLGLVACGGSDDSPSDTNTPIPAHTPQVEATIGPRGTLAPDLIHLQRDYEVLTAAHETMTAVWEGLANGQQVQCGTFPELIPPESIAATSESELVPLADHLRRAAIELDTSVALWRAECMNPRANPAPDVIQDGRLATRAAGDALQTTAPLLSAIQGN